MFGDHLLEHFYDEMKQSGSFEELVLSEGFTSIDEYSNELDGLYHLDYSKHNRFEFSRDFFEWAF